MTGLLIIIVSFAFGVAGGFLAMHFYFQHHFFVTKEEFDTALIEELDRFSSDISYQADTLKTMSNSFSEYEKRIEKKMDDHYRWSLGIWNDIANHRESIEHSIPESIQEVARAEVQMNEDEEVMPMGPIENVVQMLKDDAMKSLEKDILQNLRIEQKEDIEAAVKMETGVDISEEPKTKKKKGKKRNESD